MSTYLVPTDFTEACTNAFKHAVCTAEISKSKVYLLHMCKSASILDETKAKLEKKAKSVETNIDIEAIVKVGTYKEIPVAAKELSADIIFMGTHGAQGMQKILGSNALKLVTNSDVPYIMLQKDAPAPNGYKKIICPISFYHESKQKIQIVSTIAELLGSTIYFIYMGSSDSGLKLKIKRNLLVMKKILDKKGLKYEIETSMGKNFNKDTISLASKIKADLITIMNMQKDDILGSGLFGKNYEQELIMNDKDVPVMIINPELRTLMGNSVAG